MPEWPAYLDHPVITPQKLVKALARRYYSSHNDLDLPGTAIVTPVYPLFKQLVRLFKGKPLKAWSWKHPSFFGFGKGIERVGVIVCCPMGAPNVAITLEELASFGVHTVFFLGLAGGISAKSKVGELILPPFGYVGEGTSRYYGNHSLAFASKSLWNKTKAGLLEDGVEDICASPVWTTDALYRETGGMIKKLLGLGVRAIDMETSAVFSVAEAVSVRSVVLLWVSDILTQAFWEPHFHEARLKWAIASQMKAFRVWFSHQIFQTLSDGSRDRN